MRLPEPIRRRPSPRRTTTEPPPRQHNTDIDLRAVQLRLVHVRNRALRIAGRREQDVRRAAVRRKLPVHGHVEVGDGAVRAKDLVQVRRRDVLRQLLDYDLRAARHGDLRRGRGAAGVASGAAVAAAKAAAAAAAAVWGALGAARARTCKVAAGVVW